MSARVPSSSSSSSQHVPLGADAHGRGVGLCFDCFRCIDDGQTGFDYGEPSQSHTDTCIRRRLEQWQRQQRQAEIAATAMRKSYLERAKLARLARGEPVKSPFDV